MIVWFGLVLVMERFRRSKVAGDGTVESGSCLNQEKDIKNIGWWWWYDVEYSCLFSKFSFLYFSFLFLPSPSPTKFSSFFCLRLHPYTPSNHPTFRTSIPDIISIRKSRGGTVKQSAAGDTLQSDVMHTNKLWLFWDGILQKKRERNGDTRKEKKMMMLMTMMVK